MLKQVTLKLLSYNIHKGFGPRKKFSLRLMRPALRELGADLVCLQEVLGEHVLHAKKVSEWPKESQFEFLADEVWPHYAYGKNAVYASGHHGNAILSKFPISAWSNFDISTNTVESRGFLHAHISLPTRKTKLHCVCVHLGLLQRDRKKQIEQIIERLEAEIDKHEPLIVAGDFNDWSVRATKILSSHLQVKEAFHSKHGRHPKTFPSRFAILPLDRIYFRGIELRNVEVLSGEPWSILSDHRALCAEFQL